MNFDEPAGRRIETAASTGFLRRFADLMSNGVNANKLQDAADLIESLARRLSEAERQAREADQTLVTYRDLSTADQTAIRDLRQELAAMESRAEALVQANALLEERADEERRRLNNLVADSEITREELRRELASRNAELQATAGCTIVPLAAMHAIRNQFSSLAELCETDGNVVATTMCDIGRALADQALVDGRRDSDFDLDQMTVDIETARLC